MDGSPKLREALERAGRDPSPEAQAEIYAALLRATVLTPVDPADPPALLAEPQSDRTRAALAFSAPGSLDLWAGSDSVVELPAGELCTLALAAGIERLVLDPAGPVRVALGSWEMRRLAGGEAPAVKGIAERDRRLGLGLPRAPLGETFLATLRAQLAARDEVTAAAVFEADPVRGRRHLVVGLRMAAEPAPNPTLAALIDDLHPALEPLAPDGALLNYTRLVDAGPFPALEPEATVFRR